MLKKFVLISFVKPDARKTLKYYYLWHVDSIIIKLQHLTQYVITAQKLRPNIRNDNSAEENRRAKENNAILQLMLIVGSFVVGYIPNAGTCT